MRPTSNPEALGHRGRGHPISLALQRKDAAAALGIGVDHFDREVRPFIRVRRCGALRLWPVSELERWLDNGLEDAPSDGGRR
jgi:hypothetical protein